MSEITVKGRKQPVMTYEVLGLVGEPNAERAGLTRRRPDGRSLRVGLRFVLGSARRFRLLPPSAGLAGGGA